MSTSTPATSERRRVRVWFGQHPIADYIAEPELAERYAEAMGRRFAGLKVTTDVVPVTAPPSQPLPSERLWDITPH